MLHPFIVEKLARERQQDQLNSSRNSWLLRQARAAESDPMFNHYHFWPNRAVYGRQQAQLEAERLRALLRRPGAGLAGWARRPLAALGAAWQRAVTLLMRRAVRAPLNGTAEFDGRSPWLRP